MDFLDFIRDLERQFGQKKRRISTDRQDQAILVQCQFSGDEEIPGERAELKELCRTAGLDVVDTLVQRRSRPDHRTLIGQGKIRDLLLRCMQLEANLVVFNRNLTATQVRAIGDIAEVRVIDRTQLILDIFTRRRFY